MDGLEDPVRMASNIHGLLPVTCGSASAKFDINLFRTESAQGKKSIKCILVGSEWVTPTRFEAMGGKGIAKNWKRSIVYNKAPISSVLDNEGLSQDALGAKQQLLNTPSSSGGHRLSLTSPSVVADVPTDILCCPILAFIKASRLRWDAATIKNALIESFCDMDLSLALKLFWEFSKVKLSSLGFEYHARRDTGKRPAIGVICDVLLSAFEKLDSVAFIPPIYCEASQLLRIPSLTPGDSASVLSDTCSLVDRLHKEVSDITASLNSQHNRMEELKQHINTSCVKINESLGSSISVLSSEVSIVKEKVTQFSTNISGRTSSQSQHIGSGKVQSHLRSRVDRSANVIFFGLPEGSLTSTRELIDEISTFLIGSSVGIKDLFRVGKKIDDCCRPTIVKLCTVWDKRLLLSAKTKLKSFRVHNIFVRQDLSKEEHRAENARRSNVRSKLTSVEQANMSHSQPSNIPPSSLNSSLHSPQDSQDYKDMFGSNHLD